MNITEKLETRFNQVVFGVGDKAAWHTLPGGRVAIYKTYTLGYVKDEGTPSPIILNESNSGQLTKLDVELLFYLYLAHEIDEHGPSQIYWRMRPEVREEEVFVRLPHDTFHDTAEWKRRVYTAVCRMAFVYE